MSNERLEYLIHQMADSVDGEVGAWRFEIEGVLMFCISDEFHDRMRVISPVANVDNLTQDVLRACLEANFDRALDARYCIHEGTLWGAFIHPLRALDDKLFRSAVESGIAGCQNIRRHLFKWSSRFGADQE